MTRRGRYEGSICQRDGGRWVGMVSWVDAGRRRRRAVYGDPKPEATVKLRAVQRSTIGTPLNGSNVTHRLQQRLEAGGPPRQRFDDLRHACATLLLAQGVSAPVVMERLGHSQIALTMNAFSRVAPEMQREAADRMEAILGG